jgi:hypothetical protein
LNINGEQVTQREWVIQFQKTKNTPENQGKTTRELKVETLKELLKGKAVFVEAWEKGFKVSGEEARAYVQELKKELQSGGLPSEEEQFFSNFIRGLEISEEEYWGKIAPEEYLILLPQIHLKESLFNSFPAPSSQEIDDFLAEHPELGELTKEEIASRAKETKFSSFWEDYCREILKKAKIEILSPDLKEIQDEAFRDLGLL